MADKPFEKNLSEIKLHLGETLKADAKVQAASEGFEKLSPFIRKVLRAYLYGKVSPNREQMAEMVGDD